MSNNSRSAIARKRTTAHYRLSPSSSVISGSMSLKSTVVASQANYSRSFPHISPNEMLLKAIAELKDRVEKLEAAIEVVDELDWSDALGKARQFFMEEKRVKILTTDLASRLGTSISQAIDLCEALEKEGVIVGS